MGMAETIVIAGSLAQRPKIGVHTWVFLQYLLGFKRPGWDCSRSIGPAQIRWHPSGCWQRELDPSLQAVCQEAFDDILKEFGYAEFERRQPPTIANPFATISTSPGFGKRCAACCRLAPQ